MWIYELYVAGELKDHFNTIPEYWAELNDEDKASWKGDASVLAAHWREARAVSAYLINWHEDVDEEAYMDVDNEIKAYPDDEFAIGDCWQLTDFLRKLGTPYPEGEEG